MPQTPPLKRGALRADFLGSVLCGGISESRLLTLLCQSFNASSLRDLRALRV